MSPERAVHSTVKAEIYGALNTAILAAGLDCRAFTDGMTVQTDEHTAYEPDAAVVCNQTIADDTILLDHPVIIVEELPPNSRHVDPADKLIIHHRRDYGGVITTRVVRGGRIEMAPPGIEMALADLFWRRASSPQGAVVHAACCPTRPDPAKISLPL